MPCARRNYELLGNLAGKPSCDVVADDCSQIPLAVITEMLGTPPEDMSYLQHVADAASRMIGTVAASWADFHTGTGVLAGHRSATIVTG